MALSLRPATVIVSFAVLCAAAVGAAATDSARVQLLILLASLPLSLVLAVQSPAVALYGLVVWLAALGMIRRVLADSRATLLGGDPLQLLAPVVFLFLFTTAVSGRKAFPLGSLGRAVRAMTVLAALELFNPLQGGGLATVASGFLYLLLPMLSFWIGRSLLTNRRLATVFRTVAVLAILGAVYGLEQTYGHLPPWDRNWLAASNSGVYTALKVGGTTRAFASFASAQEYAVFLSLGFVVIFSFRRTAPRLLLYLSSLAIIGAALFLESNRGSVVYTVIAIGMMFAVSRGLSFRKSLFAGAFAAILLTILAGYLVPHAPAPRSAGVQALTSHEINGLANPLNPHTSSLRGHSTELIRGVEEGITVPIGHGSGTITVGAGKYGGTSLGTENDFSNSAEAFGAGGFILYLILFYRAFLSAYFVASSRQDWLGTSVLGLLVVTSGQWLNGDLYSVAWLIWLALGWLDRQQTEPLLDSGHGRSDGTSAAGLRQSDRAGRDVIDPEGRLSQGTVKATDLRGRSSR